MRTNMKTEPTVARFVLQYVGQVLGVAHIL